MTALVAILALLLGGAEDPVAERLKELVAADPVTCGHLTIVPLCTHEPARKAPHAETRTVLEGSVLVDDGRTYVRVANPGARARLLVAGTVFAGGGAEFALIRDALLPPGFCALVPAEALVPAVGAAPRLSPAGVLAADTTGALLLGSTALLESEGFRRAAADGVVAARRRAFVARFGAGPRGLRGPMVGAVFLVGGRPVAGHAFSTPQIFFDALPDLLGSMAFVASAATPSEGRKAGDRKQRALDWLREAARSAGPFGTSCGAGLERLSADPLDRTVAHALLDENRGVVHVAVYAVASWPENTGFEGADPRPPPLPEKRKDPPPGLRERRPRPTAESERRDSLKPAPEPRRELRDAAGSDA